MNSLITLGVAAAFGTGVAGAVVPGLPFDGALLEEPVMLLAFILLGRTLEAKARLKATGGMWPGMCGERGISLPRACHHHGPVHTRNEHK
jgi:hypothetical protein